MIDWIMSDVFSMTNHYRPILPDELKREKILENSRKIYGSKKSDIEATHIDWSNQNFSATSKAIEKAKQKAKDIMAGDSNRQISENNISSKKNIEEKLQSNQNLKIEKSDEKTSEIFETKNIQDENNQNEDLKQTNIENKTDLEVWKTYTWVVKIKFNYGLFVLVGENDWLLHKSMMKLQEWVNWKKMYEVGDEIQVKFQGFNENQWGKILFTQI